ncbi:hypothetical protein PMI01_02196 [Caulobacter sp. AP07]|uniref:hypothetical protein n=1 Tax=Caulobacter sp. AP07 TaxID=1144304 RepID=UPI0002722023|nr:hypothetical protein [Caulobacter sp. AP07]EJL33234.1 hypothetical protein PMI01_02196 [Caulobacter sp. AP07]
MIALLAAAWAFLKSPIGRWVCVALVVAGMLFAVRAEGYRAGKADTLAAEAQRVAEAVQRVAKVEKAGQAITAEVGETLTATKVEIQYRTKLQIEKVIEYVPVESDRACIVGSGALRLHDHAFSGLPGLPSGAGGPVQADSGVPLSALVADDVEFAGTAYSWKAEAVAWRDWYRRQADLHSKTIKAPDPTP